MKKCLPHEFLVSRIVPFVIYAKLLREQRGKGLVKSDQVLRIFAALKLVLAGALIIRRGKADLYRTGPTVLRSEMSAQPCRTCASFHAGNVRLISRHVKERNFCGANLGYAYHSCWHSFPGRPSENVCGKRRQR